MTLWVRLRFPGYFVGRVADEKADLPG